jgi:hypothetical protein
VANQRQALQGSAKHYELNLRRRGLYNQGGPGAEPPHPAGQVGATAVAQTGIHIWGVQGIMTKQAAEAVNPPPGSNAIVKPAGPPPELMELIKGHSS